MISRRLLKMFLIELPVLCSLMALSPRLCIAQEQVLYNFGTNGGHSDGYTPYGTLVLDAEGNLFGTTYNGGRYGNGTVYELARGLNGTWSESVLTSFTDTNGYQPVAGLTLKGNSFYGATTGGGRFGQGAVFVLQPQPNGGWAEQVIYSCQLLPNLGGAHPYGGLLFDSAGNIYGTHSTDGAGAVGGIFEISANANQESVLHAFNIMDGATPIASLVSDASGNLYGTTQQGGAYSMGSVFQLVPNGSGQWTYRLLYSFGRMATDGRYPYAALTLDSAGNLYGTTYHGGRNSDGIVFELSSAGGVWTERVLYDFGASQADGAHPAASVVFGHSGNLYGTTIVGGTAGIGTVFELSPAGGDTWSERVVFSFDGIGIHGKWPYAGVVLDSTGNIYGTTIAGGINDVGVVYKIVP